MIMEYEEMPLKKAAPGTLRKELRHAKERNINSMGSLPIIWFLTRRHRVGLLVLTNVATVGLLVVKW